MATLPDIRTESDAPVELPNELLEKWEREGRRDREVAELDAFFQRTGYPRAPRYYLIKWLTDWVRELGFDGYRVDTAKHFGESVSAELKREAEAALAEWRRGHPERIPGDLPFYMVGEVYGWEVGHGRMYDFGDREVDYFSHGYDALINFGFKRDATARPDSLFTALRRRAPRRPAERRCGAQLPQLPRRRLAVRRGPKGPAGRRHSPPARPRRRADLLRRRARAPASGRGRGGRCEPALVHELG